MARLLGPTALAVALAASTGVAHAGLITDTAFLTGASEGPLDASAGIGFAEADCDSDAHTMRVQVAFSGPIGTTTAAHIDGATAVPGAGTSGVLPRSRPSPASRSA